MDDVSTITRVRTYEDSVIPEVPVVTAELPRLTPEEDMFALAVIEYGGNVGLAYKAAFGKEADMPTARGRELLLNPLVQVRVQKMMNKLDDASLITLDAHLTELAEIRDIAKATGQIKVALQAERSRGEAGGLYNVNAKGKNDNVHVQITMYSPDQLMSHVSKKMGTVIDVTPKE